MRARLTILLTASLAAGLIAAGCGDDDETTTTTGATGATGTTGAEGPAPSQDEFIADADRLCQTAEDELDQEFETTDAETVADFARDVVVPQQQELIDDLRTLTPPEGDEEEIETLLNSVQDGLDQLEEDPALFQRALEAEDASAIDEIYADARRRATDYGFEVCGQG